jgi:NADH:ubiquinone oxidoreductase subunit 3 (subunit A)
MTDKSITNTTNNTSVDKSNDFKLSDLLPLAKTFLENQNREILLREKSNQNELQLETINIERDHDFKLKSMEYDYKVFKHYYWLIMLIFIVFVSLVFFMIFLKNDIKTGILIISHMVALVSGLIAGIGYKSKQNNNERRTIINEGDHDHD